MAALRLDKICETAGPGRLEHQGSAPDGGAVLYHSRVCLLGRVCCPAAARTKILLYLFSVRFLGRRHPPPASVCVAVLYHSRCACLPVGAAPAVVVPGWRAQEQSLIAGRGLLHVRARPATRNHCRI